MFGRNSIMFLCAAALTTLAACHPAKPAAAPSVPAPVEERTTYVDRSARELDGFAPALPRAPFHSTMTSAPISIEAATTEDDSLRVLDMP